MFQGILYRILNGKTIIFLWTYFVDVCLLVSHVITRPPAMTTHAMELNMIHFGPVIKLVTLNDVYKVLIGLKTQIIV